MINHAVQSDGRERSAVSAVQLVFRERMPMGWGFFSCRRAIFASLAM